MVYTEEEANPSFKQIDIIWLRIQSNKEGQCEIFVSILQLEACGDLNLSFQRMLQSA